MSHPLCSSHYKEAGPTYRISKGAAICRSLRSVAVARGHAGGAQTPLKARTTRESHTLPARGIADSAECVTHPPSLRTVEDSRWCFRQQMPGTSGFPLPAASPRCMQYLVLGAILCISSDAHERRGPYRIQNDLGCAFHFSLAKPMPDSPAFQFFSIHTHEMVRQ